MAANYWRVYKGLNITPLASAVSVKGDVGYNSATDKLELYNGAVDPLVNEAKAATLTNKTMDAGSNTFTNIVSTTSTATATSTNASFYPTFVASSSTGSQGLGMSSTLSYNPSTAVLTTTTFSGALSGNATSATNATNTGITDDTSTNATMYPTWVTANTGNLPQKTTSTKLTFNPSTGSLASTTFVGALTGTASGNTTYTSNNHGVVVSGSGNAMTVIAPNASTAFPLVSGGSSADPTWAALTEAGGGTNQTTYTKGDILYASATNTLSKLGVGSASQALTVSNGVPAWTTLNQGGINYLSANPGAEVDTSGWATYANTAKNIPSNGTAGSPSSTWTRTTSSPLRGTGSFLWTKAGSANRQGEGVSYDFTIDAADQGRVLGVTFDYKVASGTFTASDGITAPLIDNTTSTNSGNSDLEVFVYDKTNTTLLYVAPVTLTSTSTTQASFKGVFTTASNSTSYRLIIHTATTTTNNFTVAFDNFVVGPQSSVIGAAGTDWVAFTPTGTWVSNTTYTGFWRRKGDSIDLQYQIVIAGGAPTSANLHVNLPSGITLDTTKSPSHAIQLGMLQGQAAAHSFVGGTQINDTTSLAFTYFTDGNTASNQTLATITQAAPYVFTSGDYIVATITDLPVVGWSSNVTMDSTVRIAPTIQTFTSGTSQTYTTPAGVKWIRVRMAGAGGGGGGSGTAANGSTSGTDGGNTTFGSSLLTCNGGTHGAFIASGGGGASTINSPAVGTAMTGNPGQEFMTQVATTSPSGGNGGGSPLFGGGGLAGNGTGGAGATNSGGGGAGGGDGSATTYGGGGAGSGGCIDAIIVNPAASYTYTVGTHGSGGSGNGGNGGGNGADGYIIVEEYYLNSGTIASQPVAPTVQSFTSSSGTYTTPITQGKYPLYLIVEMVGGGGGGGGSGTTDGTAATDGGDTTFSVHGGAAFLTAGKGTHGTRGGTGGAGGTATVSAGGTKIIAVSGGQGNGAAALGTTTSQASSNLQGGAGGNSFFGGAGAAGAQNNGIGQGAATNSGSGGGGAGTAIVNSVLSGAGGGAGAFIKALITSPSASYDYSIGTGGSGQVGGASGAGGGTGAAGYLVVTEYYQ